MKLLIEVTFFSFSASLQRRIIKNHMEHKVCIKGEKNERMHESDIVAWMKKHKAQNSHAEYLMSKNEYKWAQEIDEVFKENNLIEKPQFISKILSSANANTSIANMKEKNTRRSSISRNNKFANDDNKNFHQTFKNRRTSKMFSPQPTIKSLDDNNERVSTPVRTSNGLNRTSDMRNSSVQPSTSNEVNSSDYSNIPYHLLSKLEFASIDDRRKCIINRLGTIKNENNEDFDLKQEEFIKLLECNPIIGFTKRKKRLRFFQHEMWKKKEDTRLKKLRKITDEQKKIIAEIKSSSLPPLKQLTVHFL